MIGFRGERVIDLEENPQARARRRRNAARRISRPLAMPPPVVPKPATLHSGQGTSDEEVRQRIAAPKARKPTTTSPDKGFYFDPTEPLRLIDPGKEFIGG